MKTYCTNCQTITDHARAKDHFKKEGLCCNECGHFNHPNTQAAKGNEMNKHTPGPWMVRNDPKGLCIVGNDPDYPGLPKYIGIVDHPLGPNGDNARLIAAAPELLDCLKKLLALDVYPTDGLNHNDWTDVNIAAERAIAKVEGE